MRNRIILVCGVVLSLVGRAFGQEFVPPENSFNPAGSENATADVRFTPAATFSPTNDDRWFTADFLLGWVKGARLPALVTTSPATVTDRSVAGVIDTGNATSILLSGRVNHDVLPGFRLGAGYIYDQVHGLGVEAGMIFLPSDSSSFFFTSDNPATTILGRPFLDASSNGDPAAELVAFPGDSTGNISVTAKNGSFYGLNFDLSERIGDVAGHRLEGLLGYRFAYFDDALRIRQRSVLAPNLSGISTIDRSDDFSAENVFHGIDLGFRSTYSGNNWSLSLLGKFSPGNMSRTVDIRGRTVTTFATGASTNNPAGLYALSSNSGNRESSKWTVLPEVGANLNWQLRSNVALRMGYSALFLTKVARADDHIDFNVNPALRDDPTANPKLPAFRSNESDLWIQAINLGVEVTF